MLTGLLWLPWRAAAANYSNFTTAIYIPVSVVERLGNPERLRQDWERIHAQLKVDKVYIEVQRDRRLAADDLLERVKSFFVGQGVRVAGGMALSDGGAGQFRSFCYTDPEDRAFVQRAAELAARHFDEVIQDDFFFVTTKNDSDIAAKGQRSWTQFRLDLMSEAARNLIVKPARAVNPKVKMVIKFPNWYEHFQGLGYDLEREPRIFDGIYTGTETRDPEKTDQNLQQYESYLAFRYFENIKPGGNGGGWVDTFSLQYIDRYPEQLWDTILAKAPEITLFNWDALIQAIRPGERAAWAELPTSFDYERLAAAWSEQAGTNPAPPTMARVAGQALEQVDAFVGRLGKPIGIKSYKPFHSTGEDFLHNYLGMLGIPLELTPEFPQDAPLVLLTESAQSDSNIVSRIKAQLVAGKAVVITSGLLRALQGRGLEEIVELNYSGRKVLARDFDGMFGAGSSTSLGREQETGILFPEIDFLTNDAWALVRAMANGKGYPLLLMDRYSKGILYLWVMPENFTDLYRLPPSVVGAVKDYLMRGFPVRLDAPNQVALFAYDNRTFVVESFLAKECDARLTVSGEAVRLRNLLSGQVIEPEPAEPARGWGRRREPVASFQTHLLPHSFAVFAVEARP